MDVFNNKFPKRFQWMKWLYVLKSYKMENKKVLGQFIWCWKVLES